MSFTIFLMLICPVRFYRDSSSFYVLHKFFFEDITYCERKKGSMRVYVNGEKLFTIDSNIDKEEFMEDIKRRRIPAKSIVPDTFLTGDIQSEFCQLMK